MHALERSPPLDGLAPSLSRARRAIRIGPSSGWHALDLGELWRYRDLIYFLLTIAFWLYASAVVIDLKKAD